MKKRKKRSKLVDSYSALSEFFAGHFKSLFVLRVIPAPWLGAFFLQKTLMLIAEQTAGWNS